MTTHKPDAPDHPAPAGEFVMVPREPTEAMIQAAVLEMHLYSLGMGNKDMVDNDRRISPFKWIWLGMIKAAPASPPAPPSSAGREALEATHRHVRTGALYTVVARGYDCTNSRDPMVPVVIYRNNYGCWWVREASEFDDGRFESILRQRASALPAPEPWLRCYDCSRPYSDGGFPDLVIPNDAWKKISPTGDEGGLLCPSCICKRLDNAGIKCKGTFRSGPLCSYDDALPAETGEGSP